MKKILIVDDEEGIHYLFEAKVRKAKVLDNYELLFAFNGQEALEIYENTEDLSAIITDINMPLMDGIELLTALRNKGCKIPKFVISSYTDEERIHKAGELGVLDYFFKPFVMKTLLEKLSTHLRSI